MKRSVLLCKALNILWWLSWGSCYPVTLYLLSSRQLHCDLWSHSYWLFASSSLNLKSSWSPGSWKLSLWSWVWLTHNYNYFPCNYNMFKMATSFLSYNTTELWSNSHRLSWLYVTVFWKSSTFMCPYPCEFIDPAAMVLLLTKVTNEHEVRSETCH